MELINYEKLLQESYIQIDGLKKELEKLESISDRIDNLIKSNKEIPESFVDLLQNLKVTTKSYIDGVNNLSNDFLKKNSDNFSKNFKLFSTHNDELNKLLISFQNINFNDHFNNLQKEFIQKSRQDLKVELDKIDNNNKNFDKNLNNFSGEITRIENVDLEKHFEKHQKSLSDIFNTMNIVNSSIINLLQTLNTVHQQVNSIKFNSEEIIKLIKIQTLLINQNFENVDSRISLLQNDTQSNKTFIIINIIITIAVAVLVLVLK